MTQTRYAPHLQELWEETSRLEDELHNLRARLAAELSAPHAVAPAVIAPPWDVAPYSWAIAVQRAVDGAIRTEAAAMWRVLRERSRLRQLARANDATQRVWRDTSQSETELRLI